MSYLDRQYAQYQEVLGIIDRTIASGGGIENVRNEIIKRVKELEQILEHR